MNEMLLRSWWVLALRGAIAIAFGILALVWPNLTLLVLVALFAAYALLGGVVSIAGAVKSRKDDSDWWLLLLLGLISVAAGVVAIVYPVLTALVLVLVMAANALFTGVLDIVAAVRLRKIILHEWMLVLSGAASIVFAVLVFLFPGAGALAMVWLISFYALLTGMLMLVLAYRLKARTRTGDMDRRGHGDRRTAPAHQ